MVVNKDGDAAFSRGDVDLMEAFSRQVLQD